MRRIAAIACASTFAIAHAQTQTAFGIAGDPKKATKTVTLEMSDDMRFTPAALTVAKDDTVRFVLVNKGATMHEMVLGTREDLAKHAAMMRQSPHMHHHDAWMTHVAPGSTGEIVWRFNRAGSFAYACLVPGHFEAGMAGTIAVK
jgi:uncharacterized cupredoxin-like copper-binding protein